MAMLVMAMAVMALLLTLMNGECAPPCHAHACHGQQSDGKAAADGKDDDDADGNAVMMEVMALVSYDFSQQWKYVPPAC